MLKVLCFGRLHGASKGGMERHVESLIVGLAGKVRFVNLVPSRDGPKGYKTLSELNFTPTWRADYRELNRFRIRLYVELLLWKLRYHPLRVLRQTITS